MTKAIHTKAGFEALETFERMEAALISIWEMGQPGVPRAPNMPPFSEDTKLVIQEAVRYAEWGMGLTNTGLTVEGYREARDRILGATDDHR